MDARPTGKLILILGELRPNLAWPDTGERLIGPTKARDSAHPPPIEANDDARARRERSV